MPEKATVIKEIQSRFTANITDYRKKVEQLSGLVANMTKNLDAVQRTAASAMKSPSESTQKLGRALDATVRKLQGQKEKFDGLTKSGERTAQQMEQLSQKLAGMSSAYHAIQAAADTIDLSTPIQKQADAAKVAVEQIDVKIEGLAAALKSAGQNKFVFLDSGEMLSIDQARARLEQLAQSGVEAAGKLDQLQEAIQSIGTENLGYASAKGLEQLKSRIEATTSKLGSLGDKMSGTATKAEHLAGSMRETKEKLDQQSESLSKSSRRFDALKNAVGRFASSAGNGLSTVRNRIAGIGASASGSTSRVERLLRSIRRISLASLALRVVRPIFGELTSCVNRYMGQNAAAAASIERLRNGLTNALAPAINVVINLLNQIMPYLIGIADAVASLITNIFGTGWTTVSTGGAAAADSVADSAGKASDKVDDLTDSTKDAADAQEKYNKLIAGFDEITKLEEQPSAAGGSDGSGDGSGGSGGGSGGATQTTAPGTEGIAGKLPEWLEELEEKLAGIWEVFQEAWSEKGEAVVEAAKAALAAVGDAAKDVGNTFYDVFTDGTGLTWVESCLDLLKSMLNVVESIATTFKEAWDADGTGRKNVTALFDMLTDINELVASILDSFARVWDESGVGKQIWKDILDTITGIYDTVGNLASSIQNAWDKAGTGDAIWGGILSILEDITGFLSDIAQATADWADSLDFEPLLTSIKDVIEKIEPVVSRLADAAERIYEDFILPFGSFVIEEAIPFALERIADALEAISKIDSDVVEGVLAGIAAGIGAIAAIKGLATVVSAVSDFAAAASTVVDIATSADGIKDKLKQLGELFFGSDDDTEKTVNVKFVNKDGITLTDLIGDKLEATVLFEKAFGQTLSKIIGGDSMDATVTFKKAYGQTLSKLIGSSCSATVTFKKKSGQSLSKLIGSGCSATVTFKKKKGQTLSKLIGSSVTVTVNLKKGRGVTFRSSFGGGRGGSFSAFGGGHGSTIHWGAKGGIMSGAQIFGAAGNTLLGGGEAGREALLPLDRNTEWMDKIAEKVVNQMYAVRTPVTSVHASYPGNQSDLSELVVLLRELRSDVAAIKQGEKKLSVTVQTNLDGQKIANDTVNRIIRQTRATGVNPLSAYI